MSVGLSRMVRTIKERLNIGDSEVLTPQDLVNARTVMSVINTFFGTSQLSQFMDQTNPLAELTHKRRLSALGPGGLTRERAGFEVRDVHYTHYGRLCPIETPEGPNIGLISSLSTYARINEFGFLETPYRKVEKGRVLNKIEFLSADEEERFIIAQANAPLDEKGHFTGDRVKSRFKGEFPVVKPEEVHYMDVSTNQIVSAAAALIPFLEHDDANRALMGSNMQRQSVPLLQPEAPLVGTGIEMKVARDSRAVLISEADGVVESVSADEIVLKLKETGKQDILDFDSRDHVTYKLTKFLRTNQDTMINQKPVVSMGDVIKKGDVLADGCATDQGSLALGRNVLVAFLPWRGYNFEDAIVISERVVQEDIYTSVHIEEFELQVRDTKRGRGGTHPRNSERVRGSHEEPRRERHHPHGRRGQGGRHPRRKGHAEGRNRTDPRGKAAQGHFRGQGRGREGRLAQGPARHERDRHRHQGLLAQEARSEDQEARQKTARRHRRPGGGGAQALPDPPRPETRRRFWKARIRRGSGSWNPRKWSSRRAPSSAKRCSPASNSTPWTGASRGRPATRSKRRSGISSSAIEERLARIEDKVKREKDKIIVGDELPPGIVQLVRVYIARKRKLQVGDKMAGRHGNKGVVAKVVPAEDMPYMPDGTPVDIVLNPLGVPSRMNLGQILETSLGWAAKLLGCSYISPVFNGATEIEVREELKKAGLSLDGKSELFDGRTGDRFDHRVTVGYIYMMKLSHLVEDKIHARSIGPYSLITQQPLGGKAQFGGQRFGEMEVWALEAYGAANTLQEILTVKSDDVRGRTKTYEAIVKGENLPEPGLPESFNVLLKELMGLGLDVELR